jgi:DNA-binding MarR family transcriptional regulator
MIGGVPNRTVTAAEYRALAEFRYHLRCFLRFSEKAARAAGLAPQQHQLLLAIRGMVESEAPTIGTLAERLQLHHHSTVELVDRMESRGLVRRARHGGDRRQVRVHLAPRGERLLPRLSLAHRTELRSVGPELLRTLRPLVGSERRHARGDAARR